MKGTGWDSSCFLALDRRENKWHNLHAMLQAKEKSEEEYSWKDPMEIQNC